MTFKNREKDDEKSHTYDEAIFLAGTGWYNRGLLTTLSVALLAMLIDLFGLSVVVTLSNCDFELDLTQKSILLSIPFTGSVITSYLWGYVSDTQGRQKSLFIGMLVGFIMNALSAFSPNWIVLAVFKLIGTCFSSCAQSATYTLLGESCADNIKGTYMIIMSSIVHLGASVIYCIAYFVGRMDFSYDLGFITFVPWRLFILILAMPLGITAICLLFFYESPKFLLNIGQESKALEVLRRISSRNGNEKDNYPVLKVVLNEEGNVKRKDVSLLQSMWEQTVPLFKPPMLPNTLLLYFLIFVMYAPNTSFYVWLAVLAQAYTTQAGYANGTQSQDLCSVLSRKETVTGQSACISTLDLTIVIIVLINGVSYATLNLILSRVASRKRLMIIGIFLFASLACLLTMVIPNQFSGIFYFGVFSTSICMGPIFSYYVDLYPTSFRGMAACLGAMVARISSIIGVNLVGPFIMSHCAITFYSISALLFSGILMSFLLPPDRPKKV